MDNEYLEVLEAQKKILRSQLGLFYMLRERLVSGDRDTCVLIINGVIRATKSSLQV